MEVVEGSLILRNSNKKASRELIVPPEVTTRMSDAEISSLTGLPPMTLEQWKTLFKDEVRKIGLELGLPREMVYRHPFPGPGLGVRILGEVKPEYAELLQQYEHVEEIVWCQEEPLNQGAWYQIKHRLQEPLKPHQQIYYAGRPGAAAPASGIFKIHLQQQQGLVEAALDIKTEAEKAVKPEKTKRKTT